MALTDMLSDIGDAIRQKDGSTELIPLTDMPERILAIPSGEAADWQPHPDWWNIKNMVDTGILEWNNAQVENVRYGFVVSDSNNTIRLPSAIEYEWYLSDGSYYAGESVTHTWDRTKDKYCSDGYKTRAVIVCRSSSRGASVSQRAFAHDGIDSLYVYLGDSAVTSLVFAGSTTTTYANMLIQAVQCNDLTTGSITPIGNYAFSSCRSLSSINIPDGVTSIGNYAFSSCSSLSNINIPDGVTSIGSSAFSSCSSLSNINIPDGVTSIGSSAFYGCNALKCIIVPEGFSLSLGLDGTSSISFSVSSLESIINNYADRTGLNALTFTMGATNLAKLSADIKAIATSKNITLA